jgi:hypothetical protein
MRRIAISVLVLCAALFGAQHQPSAQFIPPGFPPGVFLNRGAIDAAPNGGGWTPASLGANLVGWYDASQPVYTDTGCSTGATNGQSIQCVPDQSGNAYNVQDNFTTQSTLNTTGYNGHRVLSWSAGGGNLQTTTSPVTQFENGTVASVCAVAKISSSTNGSLGGIGDNGGTSTTAIDTMFSGGSSFQAQYNLAHTWLQMLLGVLFSAPAEQGKCTEADGK